MQSVMNHNFANIPAPEIQRSVFNRSHAHKTTFDAGDLVPIYVDEVLPGDSIGLKANIFARLQTLVFPIMDNVFIDMFFFFVPCRLLWSKWEKFQGAQDNPGDSIAFTVPVLTSAGLTDNKYPLGSIYDYFGLPVGINAQYGAEVIALPFRAYNLIWNEWFRDQNLQNKLTVNLGDGPDTYLGTYTIQKRGKRHDYFTSCLPWPQKGTAVSLPIGTSAPVIGNGTGIGMSTGPGNDLFGLVAAVSTSILSADEDSYGDPTGTVVAAGNGVDSQRVMGLTTDPANSGVIADLSNAVAATINQLRQAFAIQKVMERDARGGTRYVEMLKSHFGVTSPDFRLQRPEYLGGSSERINVSTVPQTSATQIADIESGTPQASLAGYGTASSRASFNKSFVEHGYVLGLVNVRSDITYQNNVGRMWKRSTRYDFYLPALAHLGEQAVLNQEIYYKDADQTYNSGTFGYQERWAEYRYKPSMVTNLFRSGVTGTLHAWHLATYFAASPPSLNATFIQDNPALDRVVAVPDEPHILFDSFFDIKHARPMPVYSVPGQIDRF